MNIYDKLRESHATQRELCQALRNSTPSVAERKSLFKRLRVELEAHAAAEERYLYCIMIMQDAGLKSARHALSEHHEIEELLEELTSTDPTVRGWMKRAQTLIDIVCHHLDEEESKFFQVSGKILTETQKKSLVKQYTIDYERMKEKLEMD